MSNPTTTNSSIARPWLTVVAFLTGVLVYLMILISTASMGGESKGQQWVHDAIHCRGVWQYLLLFLGVIASTYTLVLAALQAPRSKAVQAILMAAAYGAEFLSAGLAAAALPEAVRSGSITIGRGISLIADTLVVCLVSTIVCVADMFWPSSLSINRTRTQNLVQRILVKRDERTQSDSVKGGRMSCGAKLMLRTAILALISIGTLIAGVQFLTSSVCYWLLHGLVERGVKGSVTNMPYVSFVVSIGLIAWGAFTLFHNSRLCASLMSLARTGTNARNHERPRTNGVTHER